MPEVPCNLPRLNLQKMSVKHYAEIQHAVARSNPAGAVKRACAVFHLQRWLRSVETLIQDLRGVALYLPKQAGMSLHAPDDTQMLGRGAMSGEKHYGGGDTGNVKS